MEWSLKYICDLRAVTIGVMRQPTYVGFNPSLDQALKHFHYAPTLTAKTKERRGWGIRALTLFAGRIYKPMGRLSMRENRFFSRKNGVSTKW